MRSPGVSRRRIAGIVCGARARSLDAPHQSMRVGARHLPAAELMGIGANLHVLVLLPPGIDAVRAIATAVR